MTALAAPVLKSVTGERLALRHVHVNACLHDLIQLVTLEQGYANEEDQPIEAVYSFPLPLDAILLGMEVKIGDRLLRGRVMEKSRAEERYEEAVSEGDGAFLLQQPEPGLYTMNVGNLRPGEAVSIRIRFSLLNRWQGDSLRVSLPTCIAPRYGDPEAAGLRPHEIPEYTLSGTAPLSMEFLVSGMLAESVVSSPTHRLSIRKDDGNLRLSLADPRTMLDRDVVLVMKRPGGEGATAVIQEDLDGYSVLASFNPHVRTERQGPAVVKLLIDCSGSMGGMSMAQAKEGARRVVQSLAPGDAFSITAFGSHFRHFGEGVCPAGPMAIEEALQFIDTLDAHMGGTELFEALDAVYALGSPREIAPDILLITDGEVFGAKDQYSQAKRSGHRIMTVGVGLSAAESVVKRLADATGGACEIVTPSEDMAERIVRHFKRLRLPKATAISIEWPEKPLGQSPKTVETLYDGDTLHVCARFARKVEGEVALQARFGKGQSIRQTARITQAPEALSSHDKELPGVIARIASHHFRSEASADRSLELALSYQLMGEDTSYLAVDVRPEGEKTTEMPALRKVPQMVAAGWAGMGTDACHAMLCPPSLSKVYCEDSVKNIPSFMRRRPHKLMERRPSLYWSTFLGALSRMYPDDRSHELIRLEIDDLAGMGIPDDVVIELSRLTQVYGEEAVIGALLSLVLSSREAKGVSRSLKRLMKKTVKEAGANFGPLFMEVERILTV
jgi:Ca-activated chloride channel homolog